jgi:hypothetical protein
MKLNYKNGEIELSTNYSCASFAAIRVNINYQSLSYTDYRMVSKSKYIFIEKSQDEYANEIQEAQEELVRYGKKIIDGIVSLEVV